MSDSNQLVKMANDIGNFFRAQAKADAVSGIANHIRSFWTRRMIEKLTAHPEGLDDLPREALRDLNDARTAQASASTATQPAESVSAPGGDAG